MKTAHTPTPYEVIEYDDGEFIGLYISTPDKREENKDYTLKYAPQHICKVYNDDKDTAAFIVRACNSHDDLVRVLEAMVNAPTGMSMAFEREARTAIAKAKGE